VLVDVAVNLHAPLAWAREANGGDARGHAEGALDYAATALAVARVLDISPVCPVTLCGMLVDLHVGMPHTPEHRPLTRDEWERLLAAGVDLPPWDVVERLRAMGTVVEAGTA
jgi:hypothetical protein